MNARTIARWLVIGVAASVVPLLHCAKADGTSGFGDDGGAPEGGADPEAGSFIDDTSPPLPPFVECADETKQIYVLGSDKVLYRFYPDTLKFLRIGTVACPTVADTFSMAIDRRGVAWVEYTDGRLFAVNTSNAKCQSTAFRPGQTGFEVFGMGYSRNGDSADGETLYVAGAGLASLDTKSFDLKFLGSLSFGRTELTGLDTKLFAFSVGSGVIAGLNKTTAATEVVYRTSAIEERAAFAFAQWGGDFWLFTGSTRSIVTQYKPVGDTSTVVVKDPGMLIVGAGSSTCAPTTPPR
ncbi:MAG TPA: hypothetical protein VLT33_27065 [Labilithrix sp.]|nr:hypothetical protein [Labilithrix sp.]